MSNQEKIKFLAKIYLIYSDVNEQNIDESNLNIYINHALHNGLISKKEAQSVFENVRINT